jgi:hypothetical protein
MSTPNDRKPTDGKASSDGHIHPTESFKVPESVVQNLTGVNLSDGSVVQVKGCLQDGKGACMCNRLLRIEHRDFIPTWVDLNVKLTIETPNGPVDCQDPVLKKQLQDAMTSMRRNQISKYQAANTEPRILAFLDYKVQKKGETTPTRVISLASLCYVSTKTGELMTDQMLDIKHPNFISPLDVSALDSVKPKVFVMEDDDIHILDETTHGYDIIIGKLTERRQLAVSEYAKKHLPIAQMTIDAINRMRRNDS